MLEIGKQYSLKGMEGYAVAVEIGHSVPPTMWCRIVSPRMPYAGPALFLYRPDGRVSCRAIWKTLPDLHVAGEEGEVSDLDFAPAQTQDLEF